MRRASARVHEAVGGHSIFFMNTIRFRQVRTDSVQKYVSLLVDESTIESFDTFSRQTRDELVGRRTRQSPTTPRMRQRQCPSLSQKNTHIKPMILHANTPNEKQTLTTLKPNASVFANRRGNTVKSTARIAKHLKKCKLPPITTYQSIRFASIQERL